MASLKEIRGRIGSVKGTLKITSAMQLISSAKLHSAQNAIGNMVPYERNVQEIMLSLLGCPGAAEVLAPYSRLGQGKGVAVILVTSNQTLCGAFNANIAKQFERSCFDVDTTVVYAIGKYGLKHARKLGYHTVDCCEMSARAEYDKTSALAEELKNGFLGGRFSRVVMIYAHYANPMSQPIVEEDYLPMTMDASAGGANVGFDDMFIVEPSPRELLEQMLPMVLRLKMHTVVLDSTAAEHAARTTAMQMASENAEDLISELSLQYNKLRQQAITSEILDLLGGQQNK